MNKEESRMEPESKLHTCKVLCEGRLTCFVLESEENDALNVGLFYCSVKRLADECAFCSRSLISNEYFSDFSLSSCLMHGPLNPWRKEAVRKPAAELLLYEELTTFTMANLKTTCSFFAHFKISASRSLYSGCEYFNVCRIRKVI